MFAGSSVIFIATASTVTFTGSNLSTSAFVYGDGTAEQTNAILEELPNHEEVSIW
jgi:hypothetical protein